MASELIGRMGLFGRDATTAVAVVVGAIERQT
jgi:hypothetical protein